MANMRFTKVVYIRYIPLTFKIYNDFYMKEVADEGIDVEYWDISALFFRETALLEDSSYLVKTRKFNSYKQLEQTIAEEYQIKKILFVSIMTFEGRVGRLYKILKKYNCTLSVFGRNMFPLPRPHDSSLFKRVRRLTIATLKNFISTKVIKLQKKRGSVKEYDIMFLGGNKGWQGIGNIDFAEVLKAEVIKVNSDDYDNFLKLKESERIIEGDYILFLDEYLPLHPDAILFSIDNISPDQYYPDLCNYFEKVEAQFKMPVVIAAHPKATRYKTEDFFNGRKTFFGKTGELAKYCYFVLAHDSTSINYPIAFGKKIHFLTSKNIERYVNEVHRNTECFANYLNCDLQMLDAAGEINLDAPASDQSYRKYKYEYQTWQETEAKYSKDIYIEFLKSNP